MKIFKISGVIAGAVIITALGIDAADTLDGSGGTLLGQLISSSEEMSCPDGMVAMASPTTFSCVDQYEASADTECGLRFPQNPTDTELNLANQSCAAASVPDVTPWRHISRAQAQLACAAAGKRLPNAEEWYQIAIGTPDSDTTCNLSHGSVQDTGTNKGCVSAVGVYDAVGNAWEWTADDVFDGQYAGRALPKAGYVTQVDIAGVATVTSNNDSSALGPDYFWSKESGVFGVMRGGFYSSDVDGGVYAVHAAIDPNSQGAAIGFRCIK